MEPGRLPFSAYADHVWLNPSVAEWTFEEDVSFGALHLSPPDPWPDDRKLCGPFRDTPIYGFTVDKPDLARWPERGCLRCKRVYAARYA